MSQTKVSLDHRAPDAHYCRPTSPQWVRRKENVLMENPLGIGFFEEDQSGLESSTSLAQVTVADALVAPVELVFTDEGPPGTAGIPA
jgi:hypothetical protein